MVCWLVGGKCVKRKLSQINFYQHQTLSNITIDKYKQLFNQQKSSRPARDGSDRASEANKIFAKVPTETLTKPIRIFFSLLKHACLSFQVTPGLNSDEFLFFQTLKRTSVAKVRPNARSRGSLRNIQNFDIFFKADPPANTSTVQKYGPGSNGAGQDMTWPQLSPKQLVSISHATSDLIRGPGRIQLSVFNPKPLNRHAYGQEMKMVKTKCLQMDQNQCRTL